MHTSASRVVLVAVAVTLGSTFALGLPVAGATAAAVTADDPIPIDSCTELGEPGTYVLTADVDASGELESPAEACLEVTVGGSGSTSEGDIAVTILGNGHTISGDGVGIGIGSVDGLFEARNVTVSGFETGLNTQLGGVFLYDSTVSGNGVGVQALATSPGEDGFALIRNSTIANNSVGVAGVFDVRGSRIVDNDAIGLADDLGRSTITLSVVAGNGVGVEMGIEESGSVVDARFNYWGAVDGPSSAGGDAPLADPVTGRLANGSGDSVDESDLNPGTSSVRFDPFLVVPPGESSYDGHYQADLVVGDPMARLSEETLYSPQGRLVWFLHGQGAEVERASAPVSLDPAVDDCLELVAWHVADDTLTVRVAAEDRPGCATPLSLVVYEKPGLGFDRSAVDQQVLFDLDQGRVGAGNTRTFTVTLPPVPSGASSVAPVEHAPPLPTRDPFVTWR